MKKYLVFLTILIVYNDHSYSQCSDDWQKIYIPKSQIHCGDYKTVFYDDFDYSDVPSPPDPALWDTYFPCEDGTDNCLGSRLKDLFDNKNGTIIRDENVIVENGVCKLIVTDSEDPNNNWMGTTGNNPRLFNAGHLGTKKAYSFGRFEAMLDLPDHEWIWESFWMWNHDEVDVMAFANSENGKLGYNSWQLPSNDCDLEVFHIEPDILEGFHKFTFEWTPYKLSFYFDDENNQNVYRYHYLDGSPLVVDCGDDIPEGEYLVNPSFPKLYKRYWKPYIDVQAYYHASEDRYSIDWDHFPENAIHTVDYLHIAQRTVDICGGLQYEITDNYCLGVEQKFGIMTLGDDSHQINVVNSTSSKNLSHYIHIDQWDPHNNYVSVILLNNEDGWVDINYIDECGHVQNVLIPIESETMTCPDCQKTGTMTIKSNTTKRIGRAELINDIIVQDGGVLKIYSWGDGIDPMDLFITGNIILEPGATLIAKNTTFKTCREEPWKGIKLIASDTGSNKYARVDMETCTIENAEIGIQLGEKGVRHNNARVGSIDIKDCTFQNNQVGIYVAGESNQTNYADNKIEGCSFKSNKTGVWVFKNDRTKIIDNDFTDNFDDAIKNIESKTENTDNRVFQDPDSKSLASESLLLKAKPVNLVLNKDIGFISFENEHNLGRLYLEWDPELLVEKVVILDTMETVQLEKKTKSNYLYFNISELEKGLYTAIVKLSDGTKRSQLFAIEY